MGKQVRSRAKTRAVGAETMGQRIMGLIDEANAKRPPGAKRITAQSVSLEVSRGENPDVIRDLVRQERTGRSAGLVPERLFQLAKYFGRSAQWLRSGIDDLDALNVTSSPYASPTAQPIISVTGGMGAGGFAEETTQTINGISYPADAIRGEIAIPSFMLASLSHNAPRAGVHWFDVRGDSMEPTLQAGDWIGVIVGDNQIGQGGIYALRDHTGAIVVKRLEYGDKPNRVDVISDNPRHNSKSELIGDITIIGRVFARITKVG